MSWQEAMWAELDAMDDLEQIKTTGAWIEEITHSLSPALAERRRAKVVEVLTQPGWDPTMLAESIGARRSTISRLRDEHRARQREHDRRVA